MKFLAKVATLLSFGAQNIGRNKTNNQRKKLGLICLSLLSMFTFVEIQADSGPVTAIATHTQSSPSSTNYTGSDGQTYNWGMGTELILDAFTIASGTYTPAYVADNITVRRHDNAQVTGERCALFAERTSAVTADYRNLKPSLECDPAVVLSGRVINRGWLDVFSNDTGSNSIRSAGNIERIDFVFTAGINAPATLLKLKKTGFTVTEKSGNNPAVIAAITAIERQPTPSHKQILMQVKSVTKRQRQVHHPAVVM